MLSWSLVTSEIWQGFSFLSSVFSPGKIFAQIFSSCLKKLSITRHVYHSTNTVSWTMSTSFFLVTAFNKSSTDELQWRKVPCCSSERLTVSGVPALVVCAYHLHFMGCYSHLNASYNLLGGEYWVQQHLELPACDKIILLPCWTKEAMN